jgi:hypothetical protein
VQAVARANSSAARAAAPRFRQARRLGYGNGLGAETEFDRMGSSPIPPNITMAYIKNKAISQIFHFPVMDSMVRESN